MIGALSIKFSGKGILDPIYFNLLFQWLVLCSPDKNWGFV
jgi:hypothetical protein